MYVWGGGGGGVMTKTPTAIVRWPMECFSARKIFIY